mmetsp:Transcript_749/g.2059  ORF Transcript_749/g.2059 Transcript_749/m.2059 type:complete len:82 (-) Transcript_749:406-651(-)
MPTQRDILAAGRSDLHRGIEINGGYLVVGEMFGLKRANGRSALRWADPEVLKSQLLGYIAVNGTDGEMPSHVELQTQTHTE